MYQTIRLKGGRKNVSVLLIRISVVFLIAFIDPVALEDHKILIAYELTSAFTAMILYTV